MGLFSSSVTTYASQALSLIEENPKFIPSTIRNAILTGADISESLQSALTNNIALSAKHYYNYGRDYYYYGLPTGTFIGYYVDVDVLQTIIETEQNQSIYLDSSVASSVPDGRFFILSWLTSVAYSWEDHSFTSAGRDCTFISAEVTADNQITVTYSYIASVEGEPTTITDTIVLAATVTYDALYVTAVYHFLDAGSLPTGDPQFFVYLVSSGLYPDLTPTSTTTQEAPYYPVVPIRYNNVSLSNMDAYPTAKRLLKKIGIAVDDVLEGIESNPDIADIDYAYIVLGFNMNVTGSYAVEYMHNYFSFLADNSIYAKADYLSWEDRFQTGNTSSTPPMNILRIEDAKYKSIMSYRYITKNVVSGVIGVIGTVDKEIVVRNKTSYYRKSDGSTYSFSSRFYAENSSLILRKQITDTTYEEIEVRGLLHTNYVNGRGKIETSLAEVVAGNDNNNFIVPLNSYIYNTTLSVTKRINLMYDCIQIVINSYETTKLKWYQTSFFQFFILIVTIALTIYGMPELGVTLQTATATEIVVMLGTQIALAVAVQLAVQVAIKALGINGALAAILIVVAAMATYRFVGGSGMNNMPWAKEMMQAVNTLPTAYNNVVGNMTKETLAELQAFQESAQTQLKELQDKIDELTNQNTLDPLGIFALVDYYPNESIDDYYYRHCHMGNPGVLTLDAITDYVDNMLNIKQ